MMKTASTFPDSDEAWEEKRPSVDPDDFYRALKRRSDELDEEK